MVARGMDPRGHLLWRDRSALLRLDAAQGLITVRRLRQPPVTVGVPGEAFDEPQSHAIARRRGIHFTQAQELWRDSYLVEIPAMTVD